MNIISAAISTNSFAGFYAAVIISISHGLSSISLSRSLFSRFRYDLLIHYL